MLIGILQTRTQTQSLQDVQGIAHSMPQYSSVFGIVMMCSLGLPLTMGFVGEVLSLYGFFQLNPIIAFLAGSSFFVGAIYMLTMFKKVFFGSCSAKIHHSKRFKFTRKNCFCANPCAYYMARRVSKAPAYAYQHKCRDPKPNYQCKNISYTHPNARYGKHRKFRISTW